MKRSPDKSIVVATAPVADSSIAVIHEEHEDRVNDLLRDHLISDNTKRAYAHSLTMFIRWCQQFGYDSIFQATKPVGIDIVCAYLEALAAGDVEGRVVKGVRTKEKHKTSSIARHLAAISFLHTQNNLPSPRAAMKTKQTMKAIRRKLAALGNDSVTRKDAATADLLMKMVRKTSDSEWPARDRALLLLGFAGAFRRSELVALHIDDIVSVDDHGAVVFLRKSKTDQNAKGFYKKILRGQSPDSCPVVAIAELVHELNQAGIKKGFIFRRTKTIERAMLAKNVAEIMKKYAKSIGLDPSKFSGHSLRAGFVTSAYIAGAKFKEIQATTGHKSQTSLEMYVRTIPDWSNHAGKGLL